MKRSLNHLIAAMVPVGLAVATLAGNSVAQKAGGPFSVAPERTHECRNLSYCFGIAGLWVVVPAKGEATYLFGCPPRSATKGAFLLSGTDALASSTSVRVWYDGQLGAPIGTQKPGSALLFHAATSDGKRASFRPIVGCVSLAQATKRSTVSARRAAAPPQTRHSGPAVRPRATALILAPGNDQSATTSCLKNERLVGEWSAVAYGTAGPPELPPAAAVRIVTRDVGDTVAATIKTARLIPYLIHIQIGAMCEPTS